MVIISIIGSAGRADDYQLMSATRFNAMVLLVEKMIEDAHYQWDKIELRSGGAAWCDHIAVALTLKHKCTLKLFLPCLWTGVCFYDNNLSLSNPGRISNYHHKNFSLKMGYDTLHQIEQVRLQGAILDTSCNGFYKRNLQVAKCDILIAFTRSNSSQPCDGGTSHTWKACTAHKIHIPLSSIIL